MINDGDVIVGSDIRIPENKSFRFYNIIVGFLHRQIGEIWLEDYFQR